VKFAKSYWWSDGRPFDKLRAGSRPSTTNPELFCFVLIRVASHTVLASMPHHPMKRTTAAIEVS